MRILIEIEAPDWNDQEAGRAGQYQRTAVARLIRDIADRIQIGSARTAEFDRSESGLFATLCIEPDPAAMKRAAGKL